MDSVDGVTAVVTGAGSGIGRALAEALSERGARPVLADVDSESLHGVAARLEAPAVVTDVSVPEEVERLARTAGDVDVVCLNAGVLGADLGAPWEVSAHDWDRVFAVNMGGVVNGLRAFVPRLLTAGNPAHVLITGSLAGVTTFPGGGAYGPSKHAVTAVAEHAAMALSGTPVGVSVVCPALVSTGMSAEGADAAHVAERALDTVVDGTFAVVDEQWRDAVVAGTKRLVSGEHPAPPAPTDPVRW